MSPSSPAVLVTQLARLGDLAQTWPLVQALKRRWGEGAVHLLVDRRHKSLAALMVGPESVTAVDLAELARRAASPAGSREIRRLVRRLRLNPVELTINLNWDGAAAALTEAVPARRRRGATLSDLRRGQPSDPLMAELFAATTGRRCGRRHLCDLWRAYAEDYAAPAALEVPPHLKAQAAHIVPGGRAVALFPGAGLDARRWPAAHWAHLARELTAHAPVVLIGSAREARLAERICAEAGAGDRVSVRCRDFEVDLLAAILAACRLAVGVDTGTLHLAAAVGTLCLGVYFGSMNFRETGPYGDGHAVVTPNHPDYPTFEWEMERSPEVYAEAVTWPAVAAVATAMLDGTPCPDSAGVTVWQARWSPAGLQWSSTPGASDCVINIHNIFTKVNSKRIVFQTQADNII